MKKRVTIHEINTNDVAEQSNLLKKSLYSFKINDVRWTLIYLIFRRLLLNSVDGFILLNNELKKIIPHGKPSAVIGDGIDLNEYPIVNNKKSYEINSFNLCFMGTSDYPWYGIDKIIYMANSMPQFNFHFIGLDNELLNKYYIKYENVKFYGFMNKENYELILKEMDVAIGSLSLYINQMTEGSPLKGREYLAYGLPTIIGYKDTDFFEYTPSFILELPSTEDNVQSNIEIIKHFIEKSKGVRINRVEIEHLDYEKKELKRTDFIKSVFKENLKKKFKSDDYDRVKEQNTSI